jgi:hypothetical protein
VSQHDGGAGADNGVEMRTREAVWRIEVELLDPPRLNRAAPGATGMLRR